MAVSWGFADEAFKNDKAGLVILSACLLSIGSICNHLLQNMER